MAPRRCCICNLFIANADLSARKIEIAARQLWGCSYCLTHRGEEIEARRVAANSAAAANASRVRIDKFSASPGDYWPLVALVVLSVFVLPILIAGFFAPKTDQPQGVSWSRAYALEGECVRRLESGGVVRRLSVRSSNVYYACDDLRTFAGRAPAGNVFSVSWEEIESEYGSGDCRARGLNVSSPGWRACLTENARSIR